MTCYGSFMLDDSVVSHGGHRTMTIYFDHNATTPLHREVLQEVIAAMETRWHNASSTHAPGLRARSDVEIAREEIAALLGASLEEVILTGGGTEAGNLAVIGASMARRERGTHIVVSRVEHHAVLHAAAALERRGFDVTYADVDADGRVDPDAIVASLRPTTVLVSVMHANNETGAIQPIGELGRRLRKRDILFHTDAVQTVGKLHIDVNDLGVDLLSLSAHKFHGPKGAGALYVRDGVEVEPLMHGGAQEEGIRPGTYNVPAIVGLGVAARLARRSIDENAGYIVSLVERLERGLLRIAPEAKILVDKRHRLHNTLTVCFPGENRESLVTNLDLHGVAVSTGAACTAGASEPSHVLAAMGIGEATARGAVRFSLGCTNAAQEVDAALSALREVLGRKRGIIERLRDGFGILDSS